MNRDEKINELQQKLFALSEGLNSSRQQLQLLQNELDELRSDNGYKAGAASKRKAQTPALTGSKRIEQFIGLKLMHVAGIVVLVTGISIGVKYAIDKQLIAEGMRIILAYAAGIMLFVFSVRLKRKYGLFSAILFSGSMATVYFTTYAAAVYYQFMSPVVAFVLMCALTVYTAVMSVQYDRKEIAIIGMVGAYGIPFLVSANAERVVYFFTYILLINAGVLLLSFKKQWKLMTQIAMVLTWILFIGWGITRNDHSQQPAGSVFMVLYFLIFLASTVGFRTGSNSTLPTTETGQLLLNNIALYVAALAVFGIEGYFSILSPVTGCLFLLTALLAFASWKLFAQSFLLQRSLTWQSIIFLLMFIAFEWDGLTVTFLWIAISVLLFAWGVWLSRSWARLASALLMAITLLKLLLFDSERFSTLQKIGSYIVIGILLLLFSFYYQKPGLPDKQESGK